MTRVEEQRIIDRVYEDLKRCGLSDKAYLFPKDIKLAFGYSRQMLSKWCKDENIALDHVTHAPGRRKYPTKEFRLFIIKLRIKGEYPTIINH